jgi:hypothetical protein
VQKASTLFNLVTSISSATFDVDAIAYVRNPITFPIQIRRIGFDIYMKDLVNIPSPSDLYLILIHEFVINVPLLLRRMVLMIIGIYQLAIHHYQPI